MYYFEVLRFGKWKAATADSVPEVKNGHLVFDKVPTWPIRRVIQVPQEMRHYSLANKQKHADEYFAKIAAEQSETNGEG